MFITKKALRNTNKSHLLCFIIFIVSFWNFCFLDYVNLVELKKLNVDLFRLNVIINLKINQVYGWFFKQINLPLFDDDYQHTKWSRLDLILIRLLKTYRNFKYISGYIARMKYMNLKKSSISKNIKTLSGITMTWNNNWKEVARTLHSNWPPVT